MTSLTRDRGPERRAATAAFGRRFLQRKRHYRVLVKDRPAGVDLLPVAHEFDSQVMQFIQRFQEVPDRTRQRITGPDYQDIEVPRRASVLRILPLYKRPLIKSS